MISTSATVRVAVRIRPQTLQEHLAATPECVTILPGESQIVVAPTDSQTPPRSFTFDHLFDQMASQEQIYHEAVKGLVDKFLEGFNATVFAYGQTGSGKTYSMGTGLDDADGVDGLGE